MSESRFERKGSPTGLQRLFFRAPIPIYRAGLGFLLGKRLLMLEHVGRKSGETRRTVLEVVADQEDAVYVAAAWGSKAQWLANIEANPAVVFYHGSHRYSTTAEIIGVDQAREIMAGYADEHPGLLKRLSSMMIDDPAETPEGQADQIAETIPMVRLPKGD